MITEPKPADSHPTDTRRTDNFRPFCRGYRRTGSASLRLLLTTVGRPAWTIEFNGSLLAELTSGS